MNDTFDNSLIRSTPPTEGVDLAHTVSTARLPEIVASAYRSATTGLRAQILHHLLRPVGLLALLGVGAGAFGEFLRRGHYRRLVILPDDVARISGKHLAELLHYVEQRSPETLQEIVQWLSEGAAEHLGSGDTALAAASRTADLPQARSGQARGYPGARALPHKRGPAAISARPIGPRHRTAGRGSTASVVAEDDVLPTRPAAPTAGTPIGSRLGTEPGRDCP